MCVCVCVCVCMCKAFKHEPFTTPQSSQHCCACCSTCTGCLVRVLFWPNACNTMPTPTKIVQAFHAFLYKCATHICMRWLYVSRTGHGHRVELLNPTSTKIARAAPDWATLVRSTLPHPGTLLSEGARN